MFYIRKMLAVLLIVLIVIVSAQISYAGSEALKIGMRSEKVRMLQISLKDLGYFKSEPTGYFGSITKSAVIAFQRSNDLSIDGIAGRQTNGMIDTLLERQSTISAAMSSRGGAARGEAANRRTAAGNAASGDTYRKDQVVNLSWFDKVNGIFKRGDTATVTDLITGISYSVKRTYGTNHADVETVSAEDTAILRKIAGGEWNWTRRPVIVEVNGYKLAASMTARPHAGRDDRPEGAVVGGRSGSYGKGTNFDMVKGNKMDGHIDIHFLNSRTHNTGKIDQKHQMVIREAYALANGE